MIRTLTTMLTLALAASCATGYGDGTQPDESGDNADQGADDGGPPPPPPPPACTEGAARTVDPVNQHCLILYTTPLTWEGADAACKAIGPTTHLAVIETEAENELVRSMLGTQLGWLGANDKVSEGTFYWVDSAMLGYTNWNPGEPSNSGGNEDCAVIRGDLAGKWDDRPCAQMFTYVCERE